MLPKDVAGSGAYVLLVWKGARRGVAQVRLVGSGRVGGLWFLNPAAHAEVKKGKCKSALVTWCGERGGLVHRECAERAVALEITLL
jgi:hypothetical protein